MSRFLDFVIDVFRGMNSYIAKSGLPSYLLQHIENLDLTARFGFLKKRKGSKKIIDSGISDLKNIGEFEDLNGGVQLLIQDGTGLKESVVTAGAYADPVTAIANDERTTGSLVDEMYPIVHNNVLRSPAGVVSSAYRSFWFGYLKEQVRYENGGFPVTLSAGKYLEDQFLGNPLSTLIADSSLSPADSQITEKGLESGDYIFYFSPVYTDGQRGSQDSSLVLSRKQHYDYGSIYLLLKIAHADKELYPRIKAIDIFVALKTENALNEFDVYPAYFLQRVSLKEDSGSILELDGQFENANPPTYIEFDDDFSEWETSLFSGFHITFTYSAVDYRLTLGGRTENGTKVRYNVSGVAALQNASVTCDIISGWESLVAGYAYIYILYDDYYKKLGSKMSTYLNSPEGDTGLDDYKHKYGFCKDFMLHSHTSSN